MRANIRTVRPKVKMQSIARENLRRAAHHATDAAILDAKKQTRQRIKAAGLGKLAGAVGDTSSLRNPRHRGKGERAWGAIFARGGKGSRANAALSIYSEGGTITPLGGRKWLAWPNERVIGRYGSNRRRMTPSLYNGTGPGKLGKLFFIRTGPNNAVLVAREQNVSKKTGRAKPYQGKTPRSMRREHQVIVFFLTRFTRRAQRFDQAAIMRDAARGIPKHVRDYQLGHAGSGSRK